MKLRIQFSVILLLFTFSLTAKAQENENNINLIPQPDSIVYKEGVFIIDEYTSISVENDFELKNAYLLNDFFKKYKGYGLKIFFDTVAINGNVIHIAESNKTNLIHEGYYINISKNELLISSSDTAGIFYGIQTLIQLIVTNNSNIPCVEIFDSPRFQWRGMHLDVCRHFFQKDFIKRYIDFLAMYKMNTFHWHLTDDQGWRIEIKKYPKLTQTGAWRKATLIGHYSQFPHIFDSTIYGGYYTQEGIREIVKYASERNITVVPEIEMPGHSLAALTSYPELSCTGGPFQVETEWGVFDDVFCPKEETFKFLEDVLTEVLELFPGKYIHIGGDEVPKIRWKNCKHCQDLIKKEGLKDENELQSYFVKRIEKFITANGRTLIGWDEILEGGLAPNAAVMSWRGTEGGIDAARQGHDVVMTPGGYCYFDHYQGDPRSEPLAIGGYTTLEKVYSFEPVPTELTDIEEKHILGAQGNVWTEYIQDTKQVEYMVFPRICALSEVLWSSKKEKDFNEFRERLLRHFEYLNYFGINYSKAIYDLKMTLGSSDLRDGIIVKLSSDLSNKKIGGIHYTLDGSEPIFTSLKYDSIILLKHNSMLKAAYFEYEQQMGNLLVQQFYINKATGKDITFLTEPHKNYNTGGALTLIDGIRGRIPWYGKEWLGFLGKDIEAIIDLGVIQYISTVNVGVLNATYSWIHLPKSIEVYLSGDGENYTLIKKAGTDEIVKQGRQIEINLGDYKTRYVKVKVTNAGKIPQGFPGAGNDAWLFVDEIGVE